jgi:hypothetical protein
MKICKRKGCTRPVDKGGRVNCAYHRALLLASKNRWIATHNDAYLQERRRTAKRYKHKQTPKAIAYRERQKPVIAAASRAWIARNPKRRALQEKLANLIHKVRVVKRRGKVFRYLGGSIVKPTKCEDCGRKAKLVAWNLRSRKGMPVWDAWLCWGCWHVRKRAE